MGYALAATDNDAYNALVVRESGGLVFDLDRYKPSAGETVINFLPRSE